MANRQVLKALVYRNSPTTCMGCAGDVRNLLDSLQSHNISVSFVGPDDQYDLDAPDVFKDVALLAIPGGPNLGPAWRKLRSHAHLVRDFVNNGGRFLGVCLGAYLAGPNDGFDLLPPGMAVSREVLEDNNPVGYGNTSNAVVQVDWTYKTGVNASTTKQQWVFFQDGATMTVPSNASTVQILSRYSANDNISATLSPYGKGWVGLTGVHIDADATWYNPPTLVNPSGIQFDLGHDIINATLNGATPLSTFVQDVPYTNSSAPSPSSSSSPSLSTTASTTAMTSSPAAASPTRASDAVPLAQPLANMALLAVLLSWFMALVA